MRGNGRPGLDLPLPVWALVAPHGPRAGALLLLCPRCSVRVRAGRASNIGLTAHSRAAAGHRGCRETAGPPGPAVGHQRVSAHPWHLHTSHVTCLVHGTVARVGHFWGSLRVTGELRSPPSAGVTVEASVRMNLHQPGSPVIPTPPCTARRTRTRNTLAVLMLVLVVAAAESRLS